MYTLKKSLGQHFLRDETISRRIVDLLLQRPMAQLLEVGPGGGALTKYLKDLDAVDFRAVELDAEKTAWLLKTYPDLSGRIIEGSILDVPVPFKGDPGSMNRVTSPAVVWPAPNTTATTKGWLLSERIRWAGVSCSTQRVSNNLVYRPPRGVVPPLAMTRRVHAR